MPGWLHGVAVCNPLTYQVDALRRMMIGNASSAFGLATDFAVQLAVLAIFTGVATRLYPRIID
jgi:ABC-2 type transport system permease protein